MTAQLIDLAERRRAMRARHDPFAISLVWPVALLSCAAFWFAVGDAVVRAWPLVRLP